MSGCFAFIVAFVTALQITTFGVGSSLTRNDVKVTLLDAKRLSFQEYRDAFHAALQQDPPVWRGDGFHFAFFIESRPGAPPPSLIGDVRVTLGTALYNRITDPSSNDPSSPLVIVSEPKDFFATQYGKTLRSRAPASPPDVASIVLDVFIQGAQVPEGLAGTVELEQGKTWFRFNLPPLR